MEPTAAFEMALDVGKLGVATDIHANPFALAEVLRHGAEQGVTRWLILGDVVAMGPSPAQVLDQLGAVEVVATVKGNTERYVLTGDRPPPTLDQVAADSALLPQFAEVAATFAWTKGYLSARGLLPVLDAYVPRVRFILPDGTRLLAVHASLAADDGRGIAPDVDDGEMAGLFPDCKASLVFGGHTHLATDVTYGGIRYVNPGSISNHHRADDAARYAIVDIGKDSHRVEQHNLSYDKSAAIGAIRSCGIPGSDFLLRSYFS